MDVASVTQRINFNVFLDRYPSIMICVLGILANVVLLDTIPVCRTLRMPLVTWDFLFPYNIHG